MGAIDLICDLMAEGVEFEVHGERIKWHNGRSQLTPERLTILKNEKAEVLRFLHKKRPAQPDVDAFEERAAIVEYDAGMIRHEAEDFAAQLQGYPNVISFKAAVRKFGTGEYS
jgi:hypothetical protein